MPLNHGEMISRCGEAKNATVYSCLLSNENCETVRSYWWHLLAVFEAGTASVRMRHVATRFASLECACSTSLAVEVPFILFFNWRIGEYHRVVFSKWSQLGAHYYLVYLFQLLYMFRATVCPSSAELTVIYVSMSGCLVCCSRPDSHPYRAKNTSVA